MGEESFVNDYQEKKSRYDIGCDMVFSMADILLENLPLKEIFNTYDVKTLTVLANEKPIDFNYSIEQFEKSIITLSYNTPYVEKYHDILYFIYKSMAKVLLDDSKSLREKREYLVFLTKHFLKAYWTYKYNNYFSWSSSSLDIDNEDEYGKYDGLYKAACGITPEIEDFLAGKSNLWTDNNFKLDVDE